MATKTTAGAETSGGMAAGAETSGGATSEAGAGGAPPVAVGAEGGTTSTGGAEQQAAERGLAPEDVELRAHVLGGHGFTLKSSLCPQRDYDWLGQDASNVGGEPRSLAAVHVRAGPNGALELVTMADAGGVPQVQVSPLRQVGLGFSARNVATCAALVGYEDFDTHRYIARDLHLVFRKAAGAFTAIVAATTTDEPARSESKPDQAPPRLRPLENKQGALDGVEYRADGQDLYFDEPVVDANLELVGPNDERASWTPLSEGGLVTGYRVRDLLSSDYRIVGNARDISGNELIEQSYPGIDSIFSDGNFEGVVELSSSDEFVGQGAPTCYAAGVLPSTAAADAVDELPEVSAIAGQRSLLIPPDCSLSLRIKRSPGATQLRFEVQRLGAPSDFGEPWVTCVSSLGVGDDRVCTSSAEPSSSEEPLGSVVTRSAALPATGNDLWVELGSDSYYVWLDSLSTE